MTIASAATSLGAAESWSQVARRQQEVAATAIRDLLVGVHTVELLSLDPRSEMEAKQDAAERAGRWKVVAKATLTDASLIKELRESLDQGIREAESSALCFAPRHGLRLQSNGNTVVLIICFQCQSAQVEGTDAIQYFRVTRSPEPTFDRIYASLGLQTID